MQIRDVNLDDAPAVAALLTELDYPTTAEEAIERIRAINAYEDGRALVASDDDGNVIGLVAAHVMRAMMTHDTPTALITAMVVSSSARGSGIGRALIAAIEQWLRERGCERSTVGTANRRADAHTFYERLGYEHTGRRYARPIG